VDLGRIVLRCLEKSSDQRFQSARDLAFSLRSFEHTSAPGLPGFSESVKAANSIAVLPFLNASRDPDSEYLSDGITESIINSLTKVSRLKVTPRSTVFRYKGRDMDPQDAGRELHVHAVLTGRVTQRGETLVVSAELLDVAAGSQLWGERYNRKMADIFEVEEEIARKISESLRIKLSGEERKRLGKRYTENTEAYQLYLRGRHYWIKRTVEGMSKGGEFFQQAIDLDPGYALAYAGLADCYVMLSSYIAIPPKEGFAKAKAAAATSVALDPSLAEGHVSWGFIRWLGDWDWGAAEKELRYGVELNPFHWQGPYWYSILLAASGRHEEAELQIRRAQELEPLSPAVGHVATLLSVLARRYEEAVARGLKGIEIDPSYPLLWAWLGMAYAGLARYDDAIQALERGTGYVKISLVSGPLGHAYTMAGNHAKARQILQELIELPEPTPADPFSIAVIYAALGDSGEALRWLENACDRRIGWLPLFIKNDCRLDPLRGDPRFKKVVERVGLEP
jgi:TolB-like protein